MISALKSLEFDSIKEILGSYLLSEPGRISLERLAPLNSREEIEEEFSKLNFLLGLKKKGVQFAFGDIPPLGSSLDKVRAGASITTKEIYNFSVFLETYEKFYFSLMDTPLALPHDPQLLRGIRREIKKKIMPDGEIRDDATPELMKFRQQKKSLRNQILNKMNELMEHYSKKNLLRDRLVTIVNGRFVLPVATHARVNGVVHGFSNTRETVYIEPMETIDLQNRYISVIDAEKEEIERIKRELVDKLHELYPLLREIYDLLGELELMNAKVEFMADFYGSIPEFSETGDITIRNARHPLLLKAKGYDKVVPLNFDFPAKYRALLVSGPNAGGKTVFLKTIGITFLLMKHAIPVPAEYAKIPYVGNIFTGGFEDQQDIIEGESSFTSLLRQIREILEKAEQDDLVLLDELLASTDPREGAALAFVIIKRLVEKGARVFANTHLSPLKIFIEKHPLMLNAQMGFDPVTNKPNYRLEVGKIGESHALDIAKNSGIPEDLIDEAKSYLEGIDQEMAELTRKLKERERELQSLLKEIREKEKFIKEQEEKITRESKRKVRAIVESREREIRELIKTLDKEVKKEAKLKRAREIKKTLENIRQEVDIFEKKAENPKVRKVYRIKPFGFTAELVEIVDNKAYVRVGKTKIEVPLDSLYEVV